MQPPVLQVLVADASEHMRAWLASLVVLGGNHVRAQCATPGDRLGAVQAGGADVALVGLRPHDVWLEAFGGRAHVLVRMRRLDLPPSLSPLRSVFRAFARSRRQARVALAFALLVLFGLLAVAPLATPPSA